MACTRRFTKTGTQLHNRVSKDKLFPGLYLFFSISPSNPFQNVPFFLMDVLDNPESGVGVSTVVVFVLLRASLCRPYRCKSDQGMWRKKLYEKCIVQKALCLQTFYFVCEMQSGEGCYLLLDTKCRVFPCLLHACVCCQLPTSTMGMGQLRECPGHRVMESPGLEGTIKFIFSLSTRSGWSESHPTWP